MTTPQPVHPAERFSVAAIRTRDQTVCAKIAQLVENYPAAVNHRGGLWELGSDFTFAHRITVNECTSHGLHRSLAGTYLTLIQLHPQLTEMFGIRGEFPLVYAPYHDLHSAYVQALAGLNVILPEGRRGIDRTVIGIYAGSATSESVATRSSPELRLVHFPNAPYGGSTWGDTLLSKLAGVLFTTDLYSRQDFVIGDQFYGRRQVLQQLKSLIENQRVCGVFGLRKTGKTSLLMQLAAEAPAEQCFVYFDLEGSESARFGDPIPSMLKALAISIRNALRSRGAWIQALSSWIDRVSDGAEEPTLEGFETVLRSVVSHKKNREVRLVLVLDEIEHLLPADLEKLEVGPEQDRIARFFGVLRSLWQGHKRNFVFVLVGITAAAFEHAELYGRSNPLFRVTEPLWLSSLNSDEGADLLRSIGARQGMKWDEGACDAGIRLTGGHPPLLRKLGSEVFAKLPVERHETAEINASMVNAASDSFRRASQNDVSKMIGHIRKFYGDDFAVLDSLISGEFSVAEAVDLVPGSLDRLSKLGLIRVHGESWEPSALLGLVPEFSAARRRREIRPPLTVPELCAAGESETTEFKGSFSVDLEKRGVPEATIEWECLKAVLGFLNGRGGTLLIGVADDGSVLGLSQDLDRHGGTRDKLIRRINSSLRDYLSAAVHSGCSVRLEDVPGGDGPVMRIDVPQWGEPVFLLTNHKGGGDTGKLYVRNNSQTSALTGAGLIQYTRQHWQQ